jgi:heme/copper-type cytochrome/quinol oxidase subunit 4
MNYSFPLAFTMNTFTMTALMVILGVTGQTHLAANVGIIQGAIAALFLSFSANARSIILNPSSNISIESMFWTRFVLIVPLALASYQLCSISSDANIYLILALIVRRCVEWISEIHLSEKELSYDKIFARNFTYLQTAVFLIAIIWLLSPFPGASVGLFVWALAPISMSAGFIRENLRKSVLLRSIWHLMLPQLGSTMIIEIGRAHV